MKVLYVSHTGLMSGAEGALLDLLVSLPPSVEATVACPPGPFADRLRQQGFEVAALPALSGSFRLDIGQIPRLLAQVVRAGRGMQELVSAAQVDLVHANSLRAGLVAGCVLAGRGVPVVVHAHDALPATRSAAIVRQILRLNARAVISISDYAARSLSGNGLDPRIHVLYNPLDTVRFDPETRTRLEARHELGLAPDAPLVGLVGQISPWKGQETAIRIVAQLRERFPQLRLLIVGQAKFTDRATRYDNIGYLESLHRLVVENGLEQQVEFWGERADVETIVRALDVALAPSWEEPFGRSVIEAMSLQVPVLATNVGGPAEYVEDGVDGLLLPPTDIDAWAHALQGLLDSPETRAALGKRASLKVRSRFDRDTYAKAVLDVYDQVLRDAYRGSPTQSTRPASSGSERGWPGAPRLRILFVEHSSVMGGGQHSLFELMRTLEGNHDVMLACPPGRLADKMESSGFTVYQIPESQLTFRMNASITPRELMRAGRARRAACELVERLRPDIVHANSLRAGLLVCVRHNPSPVVVHCRDLLPPGFSSSLVSLFTLQRSELVVAVSEAAARRLAGPRWAERRVVVADNSIDTDTFNPDLWDLDRARTELGVDGAPLLGLIAQITPWKGHTRAIQVLARLRGEQPQAKLLIAGAAKFVTRATRFDNQAYDQKLRTLVSHLGLEDAVLFLGERNDVPRIMASLDVLLVPSTEEPFGRTVIEAMAMGVPVVATNAGGPPELIRHGIDGLTLPPEDIEGWAAAAESLARRGRSNDSRDYARQRFSSARHGAGILAAYERALREA
jgi:glycosyltransferase involved in cell wall biosynthesis